jgi:hypothetical protein
VAVSSKTLYELLNYVTLGELSQNTSLENFTLDDFKQLPIEKKNAFKKELYSSLEHEYKLTCETLEVVKGSGLNLHYTITRSRTNSLTNVVPSAVFLRKAAFFANIMVITFPCEFPLPNCEKSGNERVPKTKRKRGQLLPNPGYFHKKHDARRDKTIILGHIDTKRTGYGGELEIAGDSFRMSQDEFYALVKLICDAFTFLKHGKVFIIPSYKKTGLRFLRRYELISANFGPALRFQFDEPGIDKSYQPIILTNICLPYFTQIIAENILRVCFENWGHYSNFQKELFSKLNHVDVTNRETLLLQELQDISERFKELENCYQDMLKHCEKETYGALIPFVESIKVGLVILIPENARYKLIGWIEKRYTDDEHKRNLLNKLYFPAHFMDFSQDELYLVWRISHTEPQKKIAPRGGNAKVAPTAFISYSHDDSEVADKLKAALEKNGIVVRIDEAVMKAGANIQKFIENSIRETDVTLSIISNRSLLSAWVALESIYTFSHEKLEGNKKFIACYIDNDFFRKGFRTKATKKIDVEIEKIDKFIPKYNAQKIDTIDLNSQKSRLYDLRNNLGRILERLRNSRCEDIREGKFDISVAKIVSEIKGKN